MGHRAQKRRDVILGHRSIGVMLAGLDGLVRPKAESPLQVARLGVGMKTVVGVAMSMAMAEKLGKLSGSVTTTLSDDRRPRHRRADDKQA